MPTVTEREFLNSFANATVPQDIPALRQLMDTMMPLLNEGAPVRFTP